MRATVFFAALLSALAYGQPLEEEFPGAVLRRPPRTQPAPKKPAPAPTRPSAPAPQPVPAAPPCTLGLEVVQTITADGLALEGVARNLTSKRVRVSLVNGCPNPPVQFDGLPSGVAPFTTCAAGPCVQRPPVVLTLAPKERRVLGTGFAPWSGNDCSAPMTVQDLTLTARVAFTDRGVPTCVLPAVVKTKPLPARPATRCPPPEPCGVYCPWGQARDPTGCSVCACQDNPLQPRVTP